MNVCNLKYEEKTDLNSYDIMRRTEKNVNVNNKVKMALGSKNVLGYNDYQGTARFFDSGSKFDMIKEKFAFLTRVLEIMVTTAKQML